jgi:hypothetical protein
MYRTTNRPSILSQTKIVRAKFTEAKVSQMRAFVCRLDGEAIGWLRENAGREFESDLLRLRDGIDLLLDEAVPDGPREVA